MKISCVLATKDFGEREILTIKNIRRSFKDVEIILVSPEEPDEGTVNKLKVVYRKDQGRGIHHAYNTGALNASGDLIFFAGSGDVYRSDAGKRISRTIQANPNIEIYGFGSVWARWRRISIQNGSIRQDSDWNSGILISGLPVSHQAIFYRRDKFLQVGLLDENLKTSSDYKHLAACFMSKMKMLISQEIVAIVDNGGVSSNQGDLVIREHVAIVKQNLSIDLESVAEQIFRAGKGWSALDDGLVIPKHVTLMLSDAQHGKIARTRERAKVILLYGRAYII
jgi:hypothetical protein